MQTARPAMSQPHDFLILAFQALHARLSEKVSQLIRFASYDMRNEGWLQGELLDELLVLKKQGHPIDVDSVNKKTAITGDSRPDFALHVAGKPLFLETKVFSGQRGLSQMKDRDLPKLRQARGAGALLILTYGLSGGTEWDALRRNIQATGLTLLVEKPIKQADVGVLSLWQATS